MIVRLYLFDIESRPKMCWVNQIMYHHHLLTIYRVDCHWSFVVKCKMSNESGPKQMDWSNWEEWWLPNKQFMDQNGLDSRTDYVHEEHYSYTISPDCNSCSLENNWENNLYSYDNDDEYGDRTGYVPSDHVERLTNSISHMQYLSHWRSQ